MPIQEYTLDEYSNRAVDEDVNPNLLFKDLFNPGQLEYLHLYHHTTDEELDALNRDWVKGRGVTFTAEMENLLNSRKQTLRPPLEDPILPEKITENDKWQAYISENVTKDPDFVPTTDPDEIGSIIEVESLWFDRDKWYRGERDTKEYKKRIDETTGSVGGFLKKRGADAMDLINWAGALSPTAFALSNYEARKDLAEAGIPFSEGAELSERFKAALLPRDKTQLDVESIIDSDAPEYDDLGYMLPEAEYLYPGRPPGEQGPIIRYQRNEDGTIEKIFPFNDPGVTAEDWAEYVSREVPALAAELAVTGSIMKKQAAKIRYYRPPWTAVKEWGAYAAQTGLAAGAGDFARLAAGAALYDTDPNYDDLMKEAGLISAYVMGGNAAATAIFAGTVATYRFITGKPPKGYILQSIKDLRKEFQIALKRAGVAPDSAEARVLFDDLIGQSPTVIQKEMEKITGQSYKLFAGDGQLGPEADFALAMINMMQRQGFPADKTIETLNNYLIKNEATRLLFAEKILLQTGGPEAAKEVVADLGIKLANKEIPEQLGRSIDDVWEEFTLAIERGAVDEKILKQMGFDDVAALGVKPATRFLPGELGDETSMSRFLFEKVSDPESLLANFRDPMISRLALMQRRYVKPTQDKLNWMMGTEVPDKVIAKYGKSPAYAGLSVPLNRTSPLAKEVTKILKFEGKPNIFKEDKAMKEFLTKHVKVDSNKISEALTLLTGTNLKQQFGKGQVVTFGQLHNAKTLLHTLRKGVSGKINEPTEEAFFNLIGAIEAQQNIMLRKSAAQLKKNTNLFKPRESIDAFMERTGYGKNYWQTLDEYGKRSTLARDQGIRALIATGEKFDESLMVTLLKNKEGGKIYHPVATPLFEMLRDSTDTFGFEMINKLQRAIGAQYKKDVIDPFRVKGRRDYVGMDLAHKKWMNNHGGLIRAAFDDPNVPHGMKAWDNMDLTQNFVTKTIKRRDKALQKIMDEFEPILGAAEDPETMILRIVRGDEMLNTSGGITLRKKLMQIARGSGDKDLEALIRAEASKDIYKRIVRIDPGAAGGAAKKTIDEDALFELLTKEYATTNSKGEAVGATFDRVYGMFLKPATIRYLKVLNAAAQNEKRRAGAAEDVIRGALRLGEKEKIGIPTLGRLFFGPLNPYTYRFTWREGALNDKTMLLLQEAILDPKLADKLARQMNRKQNIENAIRFFFSLDSVTAQDIGRDLRAIKEDQEGTAFLSEHKGDPIRSADYLFHLQEYFRTRDEKQRGSRTGLIPFRETIENIPGQIPTLAIGAGEAVGDWWNTPSPEADIVEELVQ